jgi:hypothetical protein
VHVHDHQIGPQARSPDQGPGRGQVEQVRRVVFDLPEPSGTAAAGVVAGGPVYVVSPTPLRLLEPPWNER